MPGPDNYIPRAQAFDADGYQLPDVWYDGNTSQSTATVRHLAKSQTERITFHLP